MKFAFPLLLLQVCYATLSFAQNFPLRNDCPDNQKIFGIGLQEPTTPGVAIVLKVGVDVDAKKAGLLPDDEILKINGKAFPKSNKAGMDQFMREQPLSNNDFEIKRNGNVLHISINRTCRYPGAIGDIDQLRIALLALMKAKEGGFKDYRGAKIKSDKDATTYKSTLRLLTGDEGTIAVDKNPKYNTYSTTLITDLTEADAAKTYTFWQGALQLLFPNFTITPSTIDYGVLEHTDFTSNIQANCKISVYSTGYQGKYRLFLEIAGTEEKPIDVSDMMNE